MRIKHGNYLTFDIPNNWEKYEEDDITCIYNENSEGMMTMSFYSILNYDNTLENYTIDMASNFIKDNEIKLTNESKIENNSEEKIVVSAEGKTIKGDYIKIWAIARYPKLVMVTYENIKKDDEINIINSIVDSFTFKNLETKNKKQEDKKRSGLIEHRCKNLLYKIPPKWIVDEKEDVTLIYKEGGKGIIQLDSYKDEDEKDILEKVQSILSDIKKEEKIKENGCDIINIYNSNRRRASSTGKTDNNKFIKAWVIIEDDNVVIAKYISDKKTREIKYVDKIVDSIEILK